MSDNTEKIITNLALDDKNFNKKFLIKYFADLNNNQIDAVSHLDGPLLVLSGAGTGKTRVLTARLANLIYKGKAKPWNIMAVTFTNKAAREMSFRLENLIGSDYNSLWLGTFHSIAARILRNYSELVGLKSNFTIISPDDQKRLVKELIIYENLDEKKITPQLVVNTINSWKDKGYTVKDIMSNEQNFLFNGKAGKIYQDYQNRLINLNYADFADLLMHNITIFTRHHDVLKEFKNKIKYFLIDEYQDTNTAQYLWLKILVKPENNICCVGDDDQSIYGWRGAEIGNILRFEKDFSGSKIIRLEQNYRSTKYILNTANSLISNNKNRLGKSLKTMENKGDKIKIFTAWDGLEETRKISNQIEKLKNNGINYDQIAVLVRAGYQTRAFEERFVQIGLPYRVIGAKFYERQEIRDAISYFRVVMQNTDDLALERIINVPKKGIGNQTINLIKNFSRKEQISMFNSIEQLVVTDELRPLVRNTLKQLIKNFRIWSEDYKTLTHTDLAMKILDESKYIESLKSERSIEAEGRLENLKELINAMSNFENMLGFLEHIALVNDGDSDNTEGEISLMTLHASKGLEFDAVFLPCWEEGSFPSLKSVEEKGIEGLEEERRLAYVGITRAKKILNISYVSNRQIHGLWQSVIPSRFIDELPNSEVDFLTENLDPNESNSFSNFEFDQNYKYKNNFRKKINVSRDSYKNSINEFSSISNNDFKINDRVFHIKFGMGTIVEINDNKANIEFDKAGLKHVITGFLKKK